MEEVCVCVFVCLCIEQGLTKLSKYSRADINAHQVLPITATCESMITYQYTHNFVFLWGDRGHGERRVEAG